MSARSLETVPVGCALDWTGAAPDLLFQNPSTGALYLWFMNSVTLGSSGYLSSPPC